MPWLVRSIWLSVVSGGKPTPHLSFLALCWFDPARLLVSSTATPQRFCVISSNLTIYNSQAYFPSSKTAIQLSNQSIGGLVVKLAVATALRAKLRLAPGSIPGRCNLFFCLFALLLSFLASFCSTTPHHQRQVLVYEHALALRSDIIVAKLLFCMCAMDGGCV
jgi:hypothetical protein